MGDALSSLPITDDPTSILGLLYIFYCKRRITQAYAGVAFCEVALNTSTSLTAHGAPCGLDDHPPGGCITVHNLTIHLISLPPDLQRRNTNLIYMKHQ